MGETETIRVAMRYLSLNSPRDFNPALPAGLNRLDYAGTGFLTFAATYVKCGMYIGARSRCDLFNDHCWSVYGWILTETFSLGM
jgi:hypothetical protein